MGCNASYQDPNQIEINLSKVYGLLDELKTGKLPDNFGDGWDKRVYDKNFSKKDLDKATKKLCSSLQKIDVSQYSLEMQVWWRDHQKADKIRLEEELNNKKLQKDKDIALSKLTDYERNLLGIKS